MRIKPLTGYALVEVVPKNRTTIGGIEIPERSLSPEEVTERHGNPTPPEPWEGIVREIGPWPRLKNGMMAMPEFGKGSRVLIGHFAGTAMQRNIGRNFRMVRQQDVLAVLT